MRLNLLLVRRFLPVKAFGSRKHPAPTRLFILAKKYSELARAQDAPMGEKSDFTELFPVSIERLRNSITAGRRMRKMRLPLLAFLWHFGHSDNDERKTLLMRESRMSHPPQDGCVDAWALH